MSSNAKQRLMRRSGLVGLLVMAGMVAALVSGQPPALVVTAGIVLSVLNTLLLRPTHTRLSADVASDALQVSAQAAMLEVMLADGMLDDGEARRAVEVYRELTSIEMPEDAVRVQAQMALSDGDDLRGMLEVLAPELTEDEKASVLKAAVMMTVGDGDLEAAERAAVDAVVNKLGMKPDDVRAVFSEISRAAP